MADKIDKVFFRDVSRKLDEAKAMFHAFIDEHIDARLAVKLAPLYAAVGVVTEAPPKPRAKPRKGGKIIKLQVLHRSRRKSAVLEQRKKWREAKAKRRAKLAKKR